MKEKAIAVRRKNEGQIAVHLAIIESLLHTVANGVVVVLGLNDSDRNIGFVIKYVIGELCRSALMMLALDDDTAAGDGHLFSDLSVEIPARSCYCRSDELGADVGL